MRRSRDRTMLIGEFARRCRLPVSTLRYYDSIGLLRPSAVDEESGYRHYEERQVFTAELISLLRNLRIPPDRIAAVVADGMTSYDALRAERTRFAAAVERAKRDLAEIEDLLDGASLAWEIDVVDLMPRQVATRQFTAPLDEIESEVIRAVAALRSTLRRAGVEPAGPWGATFPLDLPDDPDGRIAAVAFAPLPPGDVGGLEVVELPVGPAVSVLYPYSPTSIGVAYRWAFEELDNRGAEARGPVIEEYLDLEGIGEGIRVTVPFAIEDGHRA